MQSTLNVNPPYVEAIHFFSQSDIKPHEVDKFIPEDDRNAGGLFKILVISKGTRTMLTRNIYTSEGLVNGVTGYVEHVNVNPENGIPRTVFAKFDDETIGKILQNMDKSNAVPIEPVQWEFSYRARILIREQLPLQPCWACTIHKLQGTTLETAVTSIGSKVFAKGMSYMALSHVKTLSGLYKSELDTSKIELHSKFWKNTLN